MAVGVETQLAALTAKGGNGTRVGKNVLRIAAAGDQLIKIIWRGRHCGWEALAEVGVVQQAELLVVDQLVLLALAQLVRPLA